MTELITGSVYVITYNDDSGVTFVCTSGESPRTFKESPDVSRVVLKSKPDSFDWLIDECTALDSDTLVHFYDSRDTHVVSRFTDDLDRARFEIIKLKLTEVEH